MSAVDPQPTSPAREPDASLALALAEVHVAIARAADEVDLMAALVDVLARRAPDRSELCLITCDEHGTPRAIETTAVFDLTGLTSPRQRAPMSAAPLAALWLGEPDHPLEITDLDADPRVLGDDRQALAPWRAVTILPLHDPRHGWQGCIRLLWHAPHDPGPGARFVDRVLMQTVAAAIASRRILRDHEAALAETRALHDAHARLHAADTLAELLAVVANILDTRETTGATAWLARVDADDTGAPTWLEILATLGDVAVPTGARFHVPALAQRPRGEPTQFIPDLERAHGLDPCVRQLGHTFQLRAAAVSPLRWRGRLTGLIVLGWPAPHEFTARERRLHAALARQAAVVFDSRLLLDQTRAALAEHRRQHATLDALLDNLPVGVIVRAAARDEPTLVNRLAQRFTRDLQGRELLYPGTDTPMPPSQWPIARALHSGQLVVGEAELRDDDGRRTFEAMAAPVRDEHDTLTHVIAVTTEVTARRRAEAERLAMHEALIRAQAEALAERSTPLLPIADDILVMPIVGTIDEGRGQQIMETLVNLGGRHARVAILDVTGAGTLDAPGVHALVGAARALRLRGAVPIITGLGPAAAETLADLDVDLTGVAVCGTLQAGIRHARALAGRHRPVLRDSSPDRRRA